VLVIRKHFLDDDFTFSRKPLTFGDQILTKLFDRRHCLVECGNIGQNILRGITPIINGTAIGARTR
jgi:hypothetical protein